MAAWDGHVEAVKYFIHCGCPLEGTNSRNETPLNLAVCNGKMPVVVYLVEYGAKDEVLRLGGEDELIPEVFVDASWGGHQSDSVMSRSRQGCIVLLGSSCICWWSRVQTVVAQSSAEAEYLALSESIKDILYIMSMLEELRIPIKNPVVVHEDNTACVQMVEEGAISRKTRHIAIRERLAIIAAKDDHLVEVCKIKSSDNVADILTKPLARVKIDIVKQRIGIVKL
ncbi:hypothetical protein SeLEV6574_g08095 [Synchytrium endobioticum]|uniref:Uncharacterized protein n=1 Tax=Synchytrium endobioticum TaxID=286115 RepID=A0A507C3I8_9FUNG|nr:hypothetical protein SeLEV6574_g08095 [Synchytrium endobioticum]